MSTFAEATMPPDVVRLFGALPPRRTRAVRLSDWGAASEQGTNRSANEDSWGHRAERSLVVADGMGGRPGGANAAGAAVAAALDALDAAVDNPDWQAVIRAANDEVRAAARRDGHDRTGAAFAGVHLGGGRVTVFHLGDVRVYRLRAGAVEALTVDHSVREQLARADIDPRRFSLRPSELDALTGYLGDGHSIDGFGVRTLAIADGDRLALCTDGVHRRVDAVTWQRVRRAGDQGAADVLVADARAAGGTDDATAVVLTLALIEVETGWEARR